MKEANVLYTNAAHLDILGMSSNAYPDKNALEWLDSWTIEDLSDKSPQQANDFDCGIFTLLNLCLLVEEGSITKDSYSSKHPSEIGSEKRNRIHSLECKMQAPIVQRSGCSDKML